MAARVGGLASYETRRKNQVTKDLPNLSEIRSLPFADIQRGIWIDLSDNNRIECLLGMIIDDPVRQSV